MNPFSDQLVLWVINVLIHSTVLTAVLLCVARLFRKRAAMRYWILCCGLLLVLASPAVSALVQSQGSGWLALALPSEAAPVASVAVTEQPTPANDSPMQSLPTQQIDASIAPSVPEITGMEEVTTTSVVSKPMMAADVPVDPSAATPAVKDARSPMQWLAIIVTTTTAVWAVGAMLLLMRMTIGWIRLAGILRRAEPITDPDYVSAFTKACALAGCHEERTPRLVASDEISGPLAAGIFAGWVVLPERLIAESSPIELAEVLVHEVAHVVRRDPIVVLIQNLVAAIYWPHPLVRKLNRELAKAREEVCDNFVLRATDAPIYSRTLLSLAQLVQRPETIPGSVGFFASRWRLEQRVAGLLDESRDTQTILSRRGWAFVLASTVGLLAAICVGTVTIATAQNAPPLVTEEPITAVQAPFRHTGRVIDPDGKPIAGAKIYRGGMLGKAANDEQPAMPVATSDNNGDFDFTVPASKKVELYGDRVLRFGTVVAIRDGFAPAVTNIHDNKPGDSLQLRLVAKDEPITGRILDLQGQPISGVKVSFNSLEVPTPNSLGAIAWRKMLNDRPDGMTVQQKFFSFTMLPSFFKKRHVQTNAEGRFEMPSFGSDRIVAMLIESPTIQTQEIRVVTGTPIEPISVPWYENAPALGTLHYVPNNFDFVAGPTRPITGVLSDLETGKPLSGFEISGGTVGSPSNEIATTTNEEGRFLLTGVTVGGEQTLTVLPPEDQPYIAVERRVEIPPGEDPLEIELKAPRGVWVEGAVVNQQTGEAAGANLSYFVFDKNQAYRQLRKNGLGLRRDMSRASTNDDGIFRTVVFPGSGVIAARGFREDYMMGVGDELIVEGRQSAGDSFLRTAPYLCSTSNYHTVVQVKPTNAVDTVTVLIGLDPGLTAEGRLVDSAGKPVAGTSIRGTRPMSYWRESDTAEFKAIGFTKGKSRQLLFWHEERNLAGQTVISPGARNETITLQPAGVITARLLDESGVPIRDTPIVSYNHGMNEESDVEHDFVSVPQTLDIRTDDEGRFRVPSLIPGLKYDFGFENEPNHFPVLCIKGVSLKLGETRELGDCKPLPGPHDMETASQKKEGETLSGQVLDPRGKPIAATLWFCGPAQSGGWSPSRTSVTWTQVGKSEADGQFQMSLPKPENRSVTSETLTFRIAATAKGLGFAWANVTPGKLTDNVTLQLVNDTPIRGRIVTLDGTPAAGVRLDVVSVFAPDSLPESAELIKNAKLSSGVYTNWPSWSGGSPLTKSVVTDNDGRFQLSGLGSERRVRLQALGDGLAATRLSIVTREKPSDSAGGVIAVRSGLSESSYFAEFTHVAVPGRIVRGTVVDQTSGQPLPDVRIMEPTSWASRAQPAVTDAEGKFVIQNVPKATQYRLQMSPDNATHFRSELNVPDATGSEALDVDLTLTPGIRLRGRVVDEVSGEGVQAEIIYNALFPNDAIELLGVERVANPLSNVQTEADGRFEIAVLPGPGAISAEVTGEEYATVLLKEKDLREIFPDGDLEARPDAMGQFNYLPTANGGQSRGIMGLSRVQAVMLLNPSRDDAGKEVKLLLQRSLTVQGELFDPQGKPVSGVTVVGLGPSPDSMTDGPLETNRFSVTGLLPESERTLLFLHPERSLGAIVNVRGDETDTVNVTLNPTGSVSGSLKNLEGHPITNGYVQMSADRIRLRTQLWEANIDGEGRFKVDNVPAGEAFSLFARTDAQRMEMIVQSDVRVEADANFELGEFRQIDKFRFEPDEMSGELGEKELQP